jgi:hypothetical protein
MKRKKQNGFWAGQRLWLIPALVLAGGFCAAAQSTNAPAATDYSSFSRFISDRNIFDPDRYPRRGPRRTTPRTAGTPAFALVGTMSYDKGMFAFFDGTSSAYQKALQKNGTIAGYAVTEITSSGVKLKAATGKELEMKIGAQMRQESEGKWELSGQGGELPASSTENAVPASTDSGSNNSSSSSSSSLDGNDRLKKLMEQREQLQQQLK